MTYRTQGLATLRKRRGECLTSLRRCVLGLPKGAPPDDHGYTELIFEAGRALVEPGFNEDYIVVSDANLPTHLDPEWWGLADLSHREPWRAFIGRRLNEVRSWHDAIDDIALELCFDAGSYGTTETTSIWFILRDTDLTISVVAPGDVTLRE